MKHFTTTNIFCFSSGEVTGIYQTADSMLIIETAIHNAVHTEGVFIPPVTHSY